MPADRDFYLERLYPMQDRILARLAPIENDFSLTGGRRRSARTFTIASRTTWISS